MSKTKVDFIADLLSNKAIKVEHKERLFSLVSKELSKIGEPDENILLKLKELEADIKKLKSEQATINDNEEEFIIGEEDESKGYTVAELLGEEELKEEESDEVLKRREAFWNKVSVNKNVYKSDQNDGQPISDLPKYIDPSGLYKFLVSYNQHPILKYTCHTIDDNEVINSIKEKCGKSEYILSDHQKLIESSYRELEKKHFVSPKIKSMFLGYLTGKSFKGESIKWSSDNISVSWKSPELLSWASANPGVVPNPGETMVSITGNKGFKLPSPIKSHLMGDKCLYFRQLVIHFKKLFQLQGDSLKNIIENVNGSKNWSKKAIIKISDAEFKPNLELFTDVDRLVQAYTKVIELIIQVSESKGYERPNVTLSFSEVDEGVEFAIHHLNSVFAKSLKNCIERLGESHSLLIKNQINGLCELYVKADFGNSEYAEVNLWNGQPTKAKLLNPFQGVTHILRFKK